MDKLNELLNQVLSGELSPKNASSIMNANRELDTNNFLSFKLDANDLEESLTQLILDTVKKISKTDSLDVNSDLGEIGLDSLMLTELAVRLKNQLGIQLPPTTLFEYPTPKKLSVFIISRYKCELDEACKRNNGDLNYEIKKSEHKNSQDDDFSKLWQEAEKKAVAEISRNHAELDIQIGKYVLKAKLFGKGYPLVLLNGIGAKFSAVSELCEGLSNNFHVLYIDLPGHQDNDFSIPIESMEFIRDLYIDAIKVIFDEKNISLAGYSFGGVICQSIANKLQNIVSDLFLLSAPSFKHDVKDFLKKMMSELSNSNHYAQHMLDEPELFNYYKPLFECYFKEASKQIFKGSTSLIVGEEDQIVSAEVIKQLQSNYPHLQLFRIERQGHFLPTESAMQVVESIIESCSTS